MCERRGVLFLVVGPSGVGKDSLIQGARRRFGDNAGYHFPTRLITRPDEAAGEDHQAVTRADFELLDAAGNFMMSWAAHGQRYGIPKSAERALVDGRSVIVNVSRQVIGQARRSWPPVRVLLVSAPSDALRARLAARGREAGADIDKRLGRADAYRVRGDDVFELVNADELEGAIDRLVALIERERDRVTTAPGTESGRSG